VDRDPAIPQRKRATQEHLEKGPGARNVDGGLQVQLEEDERDSTKQSWMVSSGAAMAATNHTAVNHTAVTLS